MGALEITGYIFVIVSYIIALWTTIIFYLQRKKMSSDNDMEKSNIIVQEQRCFYIIITCYVGIKTLLFVFIEGFIPFDPPLSSLERSIVFSLINLLICVPCLYVALLCMNWQVTIYDNYFTYRNAFGITRKYKFEEVKLKERRFGDRVYKNKRWLFNISYGQENAEALKTALAKYGRVEL